MERKVLKTVSFIVFGLFVIAFMGSYAFAEEAIVSSGPIPLSATRIWTAEEMAAAKPMPLRRFPGGPGAPSAAMQPTGEPGLDPGGRPAKDLTTPVVEQSEGEEVYLGEVDPLGYSYPFPFTRYELFPRVKKLYQFYPYKAVGKLFFNQGGGSWVCSASAIGNAGVWTAGHCVSDGAGNWSSNVVFVPAYYDGSGSLGQWQQYNLWVFTAWHTSGDWSRDSGGVVVHDISAGGNTYRLGNVTGYLGFAWNWPRNSQHWHVIGYPAASPFNGQRQMVCTASDAIADFGSPATIGIGCDQTGGSSGGPWIRNFSHVAGAANYLNGNVSYGYGSQPLAMYGPYFDDLSKSLKDAIVGEDPPLK
jgi:V8-like Glu-specific endopeptidase